MKTCPNCQTVSQNKANFCHHCGTNIQEVLDNTCYAILEPKDDIYVIKSDTYSTYKELKTAYSGLLHLYQGCYIVHCNLSELCREDPFTPFELFLIGYMGETERYTHPFPIIVASPSN